MERESKRHADIIASAKKMYRSIGAIICPGLGGELVLFSGIGFDHLLRRGRSIRPKTDQMRRLGLLSYAKRIISAHDVIIEYREIQNNQTSTCRFWGLTSIQDDKKITVVVRQVGEGPKYFFSIMD